MRRFSLPFRPPLRRAARLCAFRLVGTDFPSDGPLIAPRRPKRRLQPPMDASELLRRVPGDPGAAAALSTAELERRVDALSAASGDVSALCAEWAEREAAVSRPLADDALYQMDVSLRPRGTAAARVFWRDVDVVPFDEYANWFTVRVDGRRVRAFASARPLAVPSEEMAHAAAREFAAQSGHINPLLMPLTDVCSGALTIAPSMIPPRVDYLMSFYQNDNVYFRAAPIASAQDLLLEPIVKWFAATHAVHIPRIVGIGHPRIPPSALLKVRDALLGMEMNPYQIIALCVAAQFTSSLILPLALFHGVVDLPTALEINRAEEGHNIAKDGSIEGYHDIREADVVTKICACAFTWRLMKDIPLAKCVEVPRVTPMDEAL